VILPGIAVKLRPMAPPVFAVGIDIGGTKMAVAAVTRTGRIVARRVLPTEAEAGFARAVSRLEEAIRHVQDEASLQIPGGECAGIGIGCAGPVDPFRGVIRNPYTLTGWDCCDIATPLREAFRLRVVLENDADAAAMGECWVGAGSGFDPVVMLTFGTGVGGAAIVGGKIQRGAGGEHPELGHIVVRPDGPACYCGTRGCLESIASGSAIGKSGEPHGWADARGVFQAAQQGIPEARAIISGAVDAVGTAVWSLAHAYVPQRLIFGGGLMETEFERFAPVMRRLTTVTQFTRDSVSLAKAQLGNDAGLVGAAGLVLT
jgi:glucokinase